jgi:hypothetical protein
MINMKNLFAVLVLFFLTATLSIAQTSTSEQEIIQLSKDKWVWMAEKDVDKLTPLFHPQAKFVHMSGTWTTERELEIIKTGSIWYKQAVVKDTAVELVGNTAIVWNRITLHAVVRENEVSTEFTVTEVYQKEGIDWKMLALTFSSVRDTHQLER